MWYNPLERVLLMRTKVLLLLLFCFLIPVTASAHAGRTDSNGGHTDHSTGEYHFHHGHPAHQHTDGVCPYDFDDRTGENSGSSSGGGNADNAGSFDLPPDCSEASEELDLIESFSGYDPSYDYDKYVEYLAAIDAGDISSDLSYEDWLYRQENSHSYLGIAAVVLCVLLFSWPIGCSIFAGVDDVRTRIREKKEKKVRFQQEQARYQELYGGKTREEIAMMFGMPDIYVIGQNGLPKEKYAQGWGESLTFYISPSGRAYHRNPTCAKNANIPCHAFRLSWRHPCGRCRPPVPETSWYGKYQSAMQIVDRYDIRLKPTILCGTPCLPAAGKQLEAEAEAAGLTVPQYQMFLRLKEQEEESGSNSDRSDRTVADILDSQS